jgi:hypothetical protein
MNILLEHIFAEKFSRTEETWPKIYSGQDLECFEKSDPVKNRPDRQHTNMFTKQKCQAFIFIENIQIMFRILDNLLLFIINLCTMKKQGRGVGGVKPAVYT